MIKLSHIQRMLLVLLVISLFISSNIPSVHAYDTIKIVLPAVTDKSGYNSRELNSALQNKLRSQFRFPKYDAILLSSETVTSDRTALERIVKEKTADGAAVMEISYLRNHTYYSMFRNEIIEETDLVLTLTYFDQKTGQYGQFTAKRYNWDLSSVHSGPITVALDALEEMLNRLDKIFPRQFEGPRY